MFSQERYRNLIRSVGQIYTADGTAKRAELLETALMSEIALLNPQTDVSWRVVSTDSERILKVWQSLEESPAAAVVVEQFKDMLKEFCSMTVSEAEDEDMIGAAACQSPALSTISSKSIVPDMSLHKAPPLPVFLERPPVVLEQLPPAPVVLEQPPPAPVVLEQPPALVVLEQPPPAPVVLEQPPAPVLIPSVVMDTDEPEADEESDGAPEAEAEAEPEVESVESEVEPDAEEDEAAEEEEEEEGVELDPITIRGRSYWIDRASGKLYAVVDGEEVGDEVGEVKAGRVSFYTK